VKQFKDAGGQTWNVEVTGGTIKRLLDSPLKLDLGKPLDGTPPLLTRFDSDIAFKVDVIYLVCQPQADERNVSDLQFADRLAGDVLADANNAFLEAWADFFHPLRTDLVRVILKQREMVNRLFELTAAKVDGPELAAAIDEQIGRLEQEMDAEIAQLGSSSASSRQSPAATPSPAPGAS